MALPTLASDFAAPFEQVQWVVLSYLLTVTAVIVSAGRLGDIFGRRRLLLAGIGIFTAASLLCGLAGTLYLLIMARALQGIGAAIMLALAMALVGEAVPKENIGRAMGLLGTMSAVGTALGPSLGGFLISSLGWSAIFYANVPLGLLALALVQRALPSTLSASGDRGGSLDRAGTLLLTLTLAAYALALTLDVRKPGTLHLILLASVVVGTWLFIRVERRAASPLMRLETFKDRRLTAGLAMNVLVSTVMMAALVVGPFYLARALGLGSVAVGAVLSVSPILSALTGVPAGRIVDWQGSSRTAFLGLWLMAIGCLGLAVLPLAFGLVGYIATLFALAPGYQLFQAANNTAVMATASQEHRGAISGTLHLSRNLGLITGAAFMGAVFAFASGTPNVADADAAAVTVGMATTFGIGMVLIVIALLIGGRAGALSRRKSCGWRADT